MLVLSASNGHTDDNTRICFVEGHKKDIRMEKAEILL